jgi:hypothetical protein
MPPGLAFDHVRAFQEFRPPSLASLNSQPPRLLDPRKSP